MSRVGLKVTAPWLVILASFLFATMGVCVKYASSQYDAGEIVFYRGLTGMLMMLALARAGAGAACEPASLRCISGAACPA